MYAIFAQVGHCTTSPTKARHRLGVKKKSSLKVAIFLSFYVMLKRLWVAAAVWRQFWQNTCFLLTVQARFVAIPLQLQWKEVLAAMTGWCRVGERNSTIATTKDFFFKADLAQMHWLRSRHLTWLLLRTRNFLVMYNFNFLDQLIEKLCPFLHFFQYNICKVIMWYSFSTNQLN